MKHTDDSPAVQSAADGARDGRQHRYLWAGIGVMALGMVIFTVAFVGQRDNTAGVRAEVAGLSEKAAAYEDGLRVVGSQVRELGGTPKVQAPPAAPSSASTPRPARGIAGTRIDGGRLQISYSDGLTEDKGPIVGQPGAVGPGGPPGRGILGTRVDDGALVLIYSDSTTETVGRIVGRDGRGIRDVDGSTGRLIVTYTDGTTTDAGPLPVGPAGRGVRRAVVVDCRWQVTYTDGVTEDAGNACTTETVTPAPPSTTTSSPSPTTTPLLRIPR